MARSHKQIEADFSCPDCIGVLRVESATSRRRCYVCQVGHRFSTHSLLLAKEKELERVLWAAAVLLLHTATVHEQLLSEQSWPAKERRALRRRVREATQQFHTLVQMVERTHGAQ